MSEKLEDNIDIGKEKSIGTKGALALLEKETRLNFFKEAGDWIKKLLGTEGNDKKDSADISGQNKQTSAQQNEQEYKFHFEQSDTSNLKVSETWNYINNGGTFYSPSKGKCRWDKYRGVCSTGSFNVLRKLGLPKVSNSTEVDLTGDTLTKMGLKYIGEVNPKNPEKNGYKPQDGDTAVWPKFQRKSGKTTQHQATYINGHRVSDNVQNQMSCYMKEPNEPNCKIYRYGTQTA